MKKIIIFLFVLLNSLTLNARDINLEVKQFTLSNGMKWLVVERYDTPIFAGAVAIKVGGSDEVKGITGIAHMFEHMAFKGGELLKKPEEIWDVVSKNGSPYLNAYTSKDITLYYVSLPSNRLELFTATFADLIGSPSFRDFYTEKSVVEQERLSYYDGQPDGRFMEKILDVSFKKGPYKWTTIGYLEDIKKYDLKDAKKFYNKYYKAGNMVGVVVGDVKLDDVRKVAERYFSKIPKGVNDTKIVNVPNKAVYEKLKDEAKPVAVIAYHKPTIPDPAEYSFDVITSLMCSGRTSRLNREFVYKKRMAKSIDCSDSYPGSRLDNLLIVWAEPMPKVNPDDLAKEISKTIESFVNNLPSKKELEKVKKSVRKSFILQNEQYFSLAEMLAEYQVAFGDYNIAIDYPDNISKVTNEDVKKISKKYLVPSNRVILIREDSRGKK